MLSLTFLKLAPISQPFPQATPSIFFPETSILDNFNRANSTSTVGANWTDFIANGGSSGNEGILSNQLYNPNGGFSNYTAMYWNPTVFGANQEVFMTISTKYTANAGDNMNIYGRLTNVGVLGAPNGYSLKFDVDNNQLTLSKVVAGTGTALKSYPKTLSSGDKIGLRFVGEVISVYYAPAATGIWQLLDTVRDTTYVNGGNIGWYIPGNTQDGRYDDFGGGNI